MHKHSWIFAVALIATSSFAADPAWIEYGPTGPLVRTIVSGECPEIAVDGQTHRMRTHADPGPSYPVRTCEWSLPAGVKSASIADRALPVHKLGRITRVALLGDTGCRLKAGKTPAIQDCSDPTKWPFAKIAETIRAWNPDLVVHVGDYYYREASCANGKCVKVPYDWKRWNADFFTPAAGLLGDAPWIVTRGNHESCDRAAEGFIRFLDPRSYVWENVQTCKSNTAFTPPYTVTDGEAQFIVFDSSGATDGDADPTQVAAFAAQLGLFASAKRDSWLILHHPLWAMSPYGPLNATMWTAWSETKPQPPIGLALTGHIHLLEMLGFQDGAPPLAAIGNGGTALDPAPKPSPVGQSIGGRTVSNYYADDDFGFVAATKNVDGTWKFEIIGTDGKPRTTCTVGATITCAAAP